MTTKTDLVDLTSVCLKAMEEETVTFMEHYNAGERVFEMSFDFGIIYTVELLGIAKESYAADPKMMVRVKEVRITKPLRGIIDNATGEKITHHRQVGYERWVRLYDLKPVGHYTGE